MTNTKPFISLFILSLMFLFVIPLVHAGEEGTRSKTPEEIEAYKAEMRQKKEEMLAEYKQKEAARKAEMLQKREAKTTELQERKEERTEQLCENVANRIENKIQAFENHRDTRVSHYADLITRLNDIAAKLEEKGYDVTELKASIAELETMVDEYVSLYADFIAQLSETQEFACGESDGEFKTALQDSRSAWELVKEKRQEIREFYANEIREVIKELREQARNMEETNE